MLIAPYACLAASIAIGFVDPLRRFVLMGLGLACLLALFQGIVDPWGVLVLALLSLTSWFYFQGKSERQKPRILRMLAGGAMYILALSLMLHMAPGFHNVLALDKVTLSTASTPFSMFLNFDKAGAAAILFLTSGLMQAEEGLDRSSWVVMGLVLVACAFSLLAPGLLSGHIRVDPKLPALLPLWAFNNLLLVAFSEEVLFRGLIQNEFKAWLKGRCGGRSLSILGASVIFGAMHYSGGPIYVLLAILAGCFYGYAYEKTGRLMCAILVHFGLNLIHLVCFTYPTADKVRLERPSYSTVTDLAKLRGRSTLRPMKSAVS